MYLVVVLAELGMILGGIMVLIKGKLSIGNKTARGMRARIAGLILLLPLPISMIASRYPSLPVSWANPINALLAIAAAGIAYALVYTSQTQTDNDAENRVTLVALSYTVISFLYFLLFLASVFYAFLFALFSDGGDGVGVEAITRILLIGLPVIVIGILWSARYFYRKGRIKAAFLVLLIPPFLYLLFLLLQAYYWSL
jgi:hypothetical protein